MRRIKRMAGVLLCLCLLPACGRSDAEMQRVLGFRSSLLASPACSFSADVTADFGRRVHTFSLDCAYDAVSRSAALQVTAPDTIAGIAASVEGEEATVAFEDVSLELGTMAGGHVAPMQLPWLLGEAWAYGYVESVSPAGDGCLMACRLGYGNDGLLVYTYFDAQLAPGRVELYYDGGCVLSAEIENYSMA